MNSQTAHGIQRRRSLVGAFLAVAVVTVCAIAAPQAVAYRTSMHGGITTCAACHLDGHTRWTPVNEVCNTCHPGFALPSASTMCWTCHTPGQDMSGARSDVACTSACHLPDGTTITHSAHADKPTTCSACHPLTASVTDAADSPHHTPPPPPVPTILGFLPSAGAIGDLVTVTGSGFVSAYAVTFNGTPATVFNLISGTRLAAIVPAGATSGPIAVSTLGGIGVSATSLSVRPAVTARVTLRVAASSLALGTRARLRGTLTPASIAGGRLAVTVTVKRNGAWRTAKTASVVTRPSGAYAWAFRPTRRGRYRVRAVIAVTAGHTAAHSPLVAFRVR